MIKRTYSIERILEDLWSKKIVVIVSIIVFAILGAGLGFYMHKREVREYQKMQDAIDAAPTPEEELYITELRNYENNLKENEEALAIATEQKDALQEYIDNSILMKINASDVKTVNVTYVISETGNAGNINNAYIAYVNDGGLKNDAEGEAEGLDIEGWKEIINIYQSGNNLVITVSHYDADKANKIMDIVESKIEKQKDIIVKNQGDFVLGKAQRTEYTRIDVTIANTQNNNNNNLKGYVISVADCNNRINSSLTAIENYKEKNEIDKVANPGKGLKKNLLIYTVVGVVAGLVLLAVIDLIRLLFTKKILSAKDLQLAGINVCNVYDTKKNAYYMDNDAIIKGIVKSLEDSNKSLYINCMVDDNDTRKIKDDITNIISEKAAITDNITECDVIIGIIKINNTTYEELEKMENYSKILRKRTYGYIVVF